MNTKKLCWIALASLGLLLSACSSGGKDCSKSCAAPLTCDKEDGVCKCGGRGGVVCGEGFECSPTSNTCLSVKCGDITCSNGTSCDVNDGKCKCGGTNGVACAVGQVCNPVAKSCAAPVDCAQISCARNQTCDPATGRCVCGSAECPTGKACGVASDGARTCVDNACSGVICAGANVCDPADGLCKCNGAACQTGQACGCPGSEASCEAAARTCAPSSLCYGKTCPNQQTCDPVDGRCKCGGPGAPACTPDQICRLDSLQCQGGQQCENADGTPKACAAGLSCDPEDGKCKCGGRGGIVCKDAQGSDPAEVCVSSSLKQTCRRPCDPRSPDCSAGTYCYFDATVATPTAYCATPTDSKTDGTQCVSSTACFTETPFPVALHCVGVASGGSGICRSYCDVAAGSQGCPQSGAAQSCIQINGAPLGVGFCQPQ